MQSKTLAGPRLTLRSPVESAALAFARTRRSSEISRMHGVDEPDGARTPEEVAAWMGRLYAKVPYPLPAKALTPTQEDAG